MRSASPGRLWALPRPLFHSLRTAGLLAGHLGPRPKLLQLLRSLPFLGPLSFAQLERLAGVLKERKHEDGDEIVSTGKGLAL